MPGAPPGHSLHKVKQFKGDDRKKRACWKEPIPEVIGHSSQPRCDSTLDYMYKSTAEEVGHHICARDLEASLIAFFTQISKGSSSMLE